MHFKLKIEESGEVFAGNGNIFDSLQKVILSLIEGNLDFQINRKRGESVILQYPYLMNFEHFKKLDMYLS